MFQLAVGIGLAESALSEGGGGSSEPLALQVTDSGADIEITAVAAGLELTISGTTVFDGTYLVDPAAVAAAPVNLVPPRVVGTVSVGQTLTVEGGLWVYDSTEPAPVFALEWLRDGSPIPGASLPNYTVAAADDGAVLSVREIAAGQQAESTGRAVGGGAGLFVARVGGFQTYTSNTSTPSFPVDLSGFDAGDTVIFLYGSDLFAASATVGGAAAAKISVDQNPPGAGRVSAFSHVLTGPGGPDTITLNTGSARAKHMLSVHIVQNGSVSDVVGAYRGNNGNVISAVATVPNGANAIIAAAMGAGTPGTVLWGGVGEVETTAFASIGRYTSLAASTDAPGGPLDLSADIENSGHAGIVAVIVAEQV
ncbi:MAG: hypothetical protein AAGF79_08915 [Pseudomonadota bacterium]